jgi:Sortase and related acyltransferases
MLIREMIPEDIPRLAEIYRQFWNTPSNIAKMETTFRALQERDTHLFLSAVENDELVGTVMGIVCDELYGECRPFLLIENLIVDQKHRRKGVARRLLTELENRARDCGCWQMILVTEADREDACAFYNANGFQLNNAGFKKKLIS